MAVNERLKEYIEGSILPQYEDFDAGHRIDHALAVISKSMELAEDFDVDIDMVYTVAACHDLGLRFGRDGHELSSGRLMRRDAALREFFTAEQIETMAQAVEDHRASSKHEPRSIYGLIVSEADRQLDPMTVLRRTVQYGLANYPELDEAGQLERAHSHVSEKYGEGGYLKLRLASAQNAAALAEIRRLLTNRGEFDDICRSFMEK